MPLWPGERDVLFTPDCFHSLRSSGKLFLCFMVDDPAERFVRFTFAPGCGSPFEPPGYFPDAPSTSSFEPRSDADCIAPPQPATIQPPPSLPPSIARIHISRLTPKIFERDFRAPGVPLIIEGALTLGEHWKLPSFTSLFDAEATYQCRIHGGDSFATSPDMWRGRSHARHVVSTTPTKFADTISSGIAAREDCYVQADVQGTRAGQILAPQLDHIGERCGLQLHESYGAMVNMWWGPGGHTEPLHMDVTDGTLCQLRGRKHIVLFPPNRWTDLYPFPSDPTGMSWAFAQVVQAKPDFERFPRLRDAMAERVELILEEGEVLFIPACCAHGTCSKGTRTLACCRKPPA